MNPSTTANHVSAIIYVAKYIHREKAPRYDVSIITQLRRVQTELQNEGERRRPKTSEELTATGKWLSWYVLKRGYIILGYFWRENCDESVMFVVRGFTQKFKMAATSVIGRVWLQSTSMNSFNSTLCAIEL